MQSYFSFSSAIILLGVFLNYQTLLPASISQKAKWVSPNPQDTLFLQGEVLYRNSCAACHVYTSKHNIGTAPNLKGVQMRWKDYPKEDLYNFIRNSPKMIQEGHPKAVKVANQWDGVMTAYPELSAKDIELMLYFIEKETYGDE
ncbi:MAG: cytochrome c [Saprospiraceae bacterium]|nr:cytochrome c [Saprospiraceae bacterium]